MSSTPNSLIGGTVLSTNTGTDTLRTLRGVLDADLRGEYNDDDDDDDDGGAAPALLGENGGSGDGGHIPEDIDISATGDPKKGIGRPPRDVLCQGSGG